jgi:hypothetical protein
MKPNPDRLSKPSAKNLHGKVQIFSKSVFSNRFIRSVTEKKIAQLN